MNRLLIVDDEPNLRSMLAIFFEKRDYLVDMAASGSEALTLCHEHAYNLIISDVRMPDLDGMELLKEINSREDAPPVILITAYGSDQKSLEAIRMGAADYIKKPFDMEELLFRVTRAIQRTDLEKKVVDLEEELAGKYHFGNIAGKSPAILKVISTIKQVAPLDTTIMITGESGTGKELIARAIHYNGMRRNDRFVGINCGALPENLLESELFGHLRGSFTGADRDRPGLFQEADGGTIFLDEISETAPTMQVKLLRALQERQIRPVGSSREIPVDVRIIAATNMDLKEAVAEGKFREDLYYRINVISIEVPPLRKRKQDVPVLVSHFMKKFCDSQSVSPKKITAEAMKVLEQYSWPGNVRELENVIERTMALEAGNTITPASLPGHLRVQSGGEELALEMPEDGLDLKSYVDAITKRAVELALERCGGNQTLAARLLHMSPRSLRYLIKKHGVDR